MENLKVYEQVRNVPDSAKKTIGAGRLKGMTDINPMWRIKKLTEMFGPVGKGWLYKITKKEIIDGADGVKCAFVDIDLYVKYDDRDWSEPIPGTGGSSFVASESKGLYTSDECFKMALTDALSVACKAIGIGADVYWKEDKTKFDDKKDEPKKQAPKMSARETLIYTLQKMGKDVAAYGLENKLTKDTPDSVYEEHIKKLKAEAKGENK